MNEVRIATRSSALALAQARRVAELIVKAHPDVSVRLVGVVTSGDRDRDSSVAALTEVGAFVRSVQDAVLDDRADLAVHSLKDLPIVGPPALEVVAFPERRSPFDAMVGSTVDELQPESVVGTGSPRRAAQLAQLRPNVRTTELRGNVDTRLRRISEGWVTAAILAEAGLQRLGRTGAIAERLDAARMVPAPGQGALAVEARHGSEAAELAGAIDDPSVRRVALAERGLLAATGAGCRAALGALATSEGGSIRLEAFVADERGPRRSSVTGESVESVVTAARVDLGL